MEKGLQVLWLISYPVYMRRICREECQTIEVKKSYFSSSAGTKKILNPFYDENRHIIVSFFSKVLYNNMLEEY
jgi:hypothetical protein